ncbi:protein ABHD15 [Salvelinus fontinalis]|uniref:protein ABHD15 n=1 Tax=Salvelinus fontinalis TaxID=8038 RepID=UPI0024863889|nr:protein ABHD15 [Salvelinus fontinalis]
MATDQDVVSSCEWECDRVSYLLPSLLLFLLYLALRWPPVQRMARLGVKAAAWGLWVTLCWVLELPIHRPDTEPGWGKERGGTQGHGSSPGLAIGPSPDKSWGRERGMGLGLGLHPALSPAPGPTLACKPTALARFLLQHCCSLARPRLASWPRGDPHLQTLSGLLLGGLTAGDQGQEEVNFTRDHLLLKDGGVVALDWAVGVSGREAAGQERGKEHHPGGKALGCHTSTPPILLLIPHYWGGVTPHLRGLCRMALRQGFYALVFHRRGTGGCPLTTPRLTEYGDSADLVQTVAYVRSRHPSSVLVAVSEGSGSGLLLSYLGECGSSSYLTAAACISPVLQGQLWFDTPPPPLYRWAVLVQRKLQLSRYASALSGVFDVDRALHCSSLRDFEETLFCSALRPDIPHHPTSHTPTPGARTASATPTTKPVAAVLPLNTPHLTGPHNTKLEAKTVSPTHASTPRVPTARAGDTAPHQHTPHHSTGPLQPGAPASTSGAPASTSGARSGLAGASGVGGVAAWVLGERGHPARDWESYWERNEPLRDADEVAVPVLCLCSRDDPLLPPPSTLPLALFQNNPYFLLALTETGGHCGFGLEEGGQGEGEVGGNWSNVSVLENFRVVAEFLKGEERKGTRWGGVGGVRAQAGGGRGAVPCYPPRRKRESMMKRERPSTQSHTQEHLNDGWGGGRGGEEGQFTWQRSYTR